jgi:hypothetical protein
MGKELEEGGGCLDVRCEKGIFRICMGMRMSRWGRDRMGRGG